MQVNFLVDCDLDTSRDIIRSATHVFEISSNISDNSEHTSSSNDAITSNVPSENKEHDKKRRKLDHLIDSAGDRRRGQFLVETPEFSSIDWNSIDFILSYFGFTYITEYTDFKGKIYATAPTFLDGKMPSQF